MLLTLLGSALAFLPPPPQDAAADAAPIVRTLEGHTGHVARVAIDPKGKVLATAGHDQTVRLWDTETWEERVIWHTPGQQFALAISPDGKLVAAAGDFVVRVWKIPRLPKRRTEDGSKPIAELKVPGGLGGQGGTVWDLAFAPDGKTLAAGTFDGKVVLWDARRWDELAVLDAHTAAADGNNLVEFVGWSPDGESLVSGGKTAETIVWKIAGRGSRRGDRVQWQVGEDADGPPAHRMCGAFAPRGGRLAVGGTDGKLWLIAPDGDSYAVAHDVRAHPGSYAHGLAFAADGSRLYTVGDDLRIWNPDDGSLLHTLPLGGAAHSVAILPDGSRAVVAEFDGPLRVVELPKD